jgi:hypothetical protein
MASSTRLIEEAADELGRLDAIAGYAPPAVAQALRLGAIAQLGRLASDGASPVPLHALAAADGDPLHDADLPAAVLHWRDLIRSEERRVRSGAPLASQRFAIVAPALSTYTERPRLEAIWREVGTERPVLARALDAAAWSPDPALGEAVAALALCAGGRADHVRLLPFADVPADERQVALASWRAGDAAPWERLGLAAVARRARGVRQRIESLIGGLADETVRLDGLGRAAITARRALDVLRVRFVTTMPALAESLECSRPAAADALDRLVAAGVAREVTGRARDRVYVWGAACTVADATTVS